MDKAQQKTWKDRVLPDGHLPASYEVQVCDEGNKVIAVQMLDKSGIDYKISARKGQFFIQAADMQAFTKIKNVLNQSLDMNKEADKMGFKPEMPTDVTPVSTNTPQADITASNVAVTEPVKEGTVLYQTDLDDIAMKKAFKDAGCDQHQWEVWTMAWNAALAYATKTKKVNESYPKEKTIAYEIKNIKKLMKQHYPEWSNSVNEDFEQYLEDAFVAGYEASNTGQSRDKLLDKACKEGKQKIKRDFPEWSKMVDDMAQYLEHAFNAGYDWS